jgi:hypothetical protein
VKRDAREGQRKSGGYMKKSVKEAVKVESGKETSKIECQLCEKGTPHLMCVMGKDGIFMSTHLFPINIL